MSHPLNFDHVLLMGFGGPERAEDILPFLKAVTAGKRVPQARLDVRASHYAALGHSSPYNAHVRRFAGKLGERLRAGGRALPVFVSMKYWHPFPDEVIPKIAGEGLRTGLCVILANYRSWASCREHKIKVLSAARDAGVRYEFLGGWSGEEGFVQSQADEITRMLEKAGGRGDLEKTAVIFTAHAIPKAMNEGCPFCRYSGEVETSCARIAARLSIGEWRVAYQSRSGDPGEPWLGPDIREVIRELAGGPLRHIGVVPVGFLCDHVEVLYDLDREAGQLAASLGLHYERAATLLHQPRFLEMLTGLIAKRLQGEEVSGREHPCEDEL